MIVYKGMRGNMTCTMGKGIYQYEVGKTYREEQSKAANTGFHSVENPLYVLHWYGTGDSRYFMCEAGGSIDEAKEDNKIASTELTILKELTIKELAGHGMMWMVNHPSRAWEHDICCCQVRKDQAEMKLSCHSQRGKSQGARCGRSCPGTDPGGGRGDNRGQAARSNWGCPAMDMVCPGWGYAQRRKGDGET